MQWPVIWPPIDLDSNKDVYTGVLAEISSYLDIVYWLIPYSCTRHERRPSLCVYCSTPLYTLHTLAFNHLFFRP